MPFAPTVAVIQTGSDEAGDSEDAATASMAEPAALSSALAARVAARWVMNCCSPATVPPAGPPPGSVTVPVKFCWNSAYEYSFSGSACTAASIS